MRGKVIIWAAAAVAPPALPSAGSAGVALPTVELPGRDSVVGRADP